MALYTYQKSTAYLKKYYQQQFLQAPSPPPPPPKKFRLIFILPPFLMLVGLILIVSALWPFVSYELFLSPKFSQQVLKPIPESSLRTTASASQESQKPTSSDYTKASTWFPSAPQEDSSARETQYLISIPKLKIKDALVKVGGEDLSKSMIQYGGTASPGNYGNTVIFCHSVLPQFFNPKAYNTICSTLPTVQRGDLIFIDYDEIRYQYQIFDLFEVEPDDISVLEQHYDNFYLSLITCVPPGSYWKRLVVKAKLVQ